MCARTTAAAFRGKHEALRGNDAQPASTADTVEFGFFVGLDVPDAVEMCAVKHAVIAGSHVAATAALREISADFGAFA